MYVKTEINIYNKPPFFITPLLNEPIIIQVNETLPGHFEDYEFQIPPVADNEDLDSNSVKIDVKSLNSQFMSYDAVNRKIVMKSIDMTLVGTYHIQISLTDKAGDTSNYNLVFIIKADNVVNRKTKKKNPIKIEAVSTAAENQFPKGMTEAYEVIDKRTGQKISKRKWKGIEYEALHANITSIGNMGTVKISFDQAMLV